jgi:hypothetical protein
MADNITNNVSSLTNLDIIRNLKASNLPTNFGNQIKSSSQQVVNTIDNISLKDPFAEQKQKQKESQERIKKLKSSIKKEKSTSKKDLTKTVLQNARKTLVPILTLLLVNKLGEIIDKNNTIKKLVDNTNKIIEEANKSNDPTKLENARIVRDNAIRVIQDNEKKIIQLSKQIETLSPFLTLFTTIVNIVSPPILSTPVPSPAPDVVTPPKETYRRRVYEPALDILNALAALLPIIIIILQKLISILEGYKAQLLAINGQLEAKLPPIPVDLGTADYGEYKGFKFALREENNPRFEVRGNKRHFAVAINKQNVEQLKSDASFTLDPNDLIEQLKLIIDQQNLQG